MRQRFFYVYTVHSVEEALTIIVKDYEMIHTSHRFAKDWRESRPHSFFLFSISFTIFLLFAYVSIYLIGNPLLSNSFIKFKIKG